MKIPLHIKPSDNSEDANLVRIALHTEMFHVTGGRGFRQTGKNPTRIERLGAASFA